MIVDMHFHSNHSIDARGSITNLILGLDSNDIESISITDHNSLTQHQEIIDVLPKNKFISNRVFFGVELSCICDVTPGVELHILAYWNNSPVLDHESDIVKLIDGIKSITQVQFRLMTEEINTIEKSSLLNFWNSYRKAHLNPSVVEHPFIFTLFNRSLAVEFQDDYKKKRKAIKERVLESLDWPQFPSCEEVINKIVSSNGVAVLAHPERYKLSNGVFSNLLQSLVNYGLCGIENREGSYSNYISEFELLESQGSDLHDLTCFGSKPHLDRFINKVDISPLQNKIKSCVC